MFKSPLLLIFSLMLIITVSFAQNRNANVYFSQTVGIDFLNQQLLAPIPRPLAWGMSTISDEKTGKLLFYADQAGIYRPDHSLMNNGSFDTGGSIPVPMIVPDPASDEFYYVFYSWDAKLYYAVVDVKNGNVVSKWNFLYDNVGAELRCVSYVHNKGWWVIGRNFLTNEVYAFLVLKSGIVKKPVISTYVRRMDFFDLEYSSHKGDKFLAIESSKEYTGTFKRAVEVSLLDFDKRCGRLSFSKSIYKDSVVTSTWTQIAAFSPDDSKIYFSVDSNVFQCSGNNYADKALCFTHVQSFTDAAMFPGPDGNLYYIKADWDEAHVYKISNPNQKVPLCKAQVWQTIKEHHGQLSIPFQIIDNSTPPDPIGFTFDNACTGYKVQFSLSNDSLYDSVEWFFGDSTNPNAFSSERKPVYTYKSGKDYNVQLIGHICGRADTVAKTIAVREKVVVQLGPDTFFCYGEKTKLNAVTSGGEYLWSTGSTDSSIWVNKEGKYWLRLKNGDCSVADTIRVQQTPKVWTALGDLYYICDDDKELVKLDAGEKFVQYKWTPTGDTSQWIVVGDLGAYFVVVKDYRGCNGKDGTRVERRCPVSVFYPNAFTPNDDGVNDLFLPVGSDVLSFSIAIYNAWGQRVFESNDLTKGWDGTLNGKPAPDGTYVYQSTYSGFRNKQMVSFDVKGNITLLR